MKAEEKSQLNIFLDTVYSWAGEIPVGVCACQPMPIFTDDDEKTFELNNNEDSSSKTLDNIVSKIINCNRCSLYSTRKNVVPGMGVNNPLVMVIGEAPGAEEDEQGLPFVGAAGQLLDKMLIAIQLDRNTNCYIANILKCRPPKNRDPYPEEADACRSFLDAQIQILRPKMILTMGRIATQNLLKTNQGINQLRGNFFEYKGIPVMPTYHPSALLRDNSLKRFAWEDLKAFRTKLNNILAEISN